MDRTQARAEIADEVTRILPDVHPAALPWHKHLRDLGADSIERVEILLGVVRRFGLPTPLSEFAGLPDLNAVVDLVLDHANA